MGLKLIIMGTTPFSIMLYKIIEKEQFASVLAFTTGRAFMDKTELEGIPIVAFVELSDSFDMNQCMILNTIGYSQMNDIRKKVFFQIREEGYKLCTFISANANVYTDKIGDGSIIMPGAFVGPYVELGVSDIIYANVSLTHHITIGDFVFIGSGCVVGGNVKIGDNCFVGLNSTIKNKAKIPSYTLIGSGTNVLSSITEGKGAVYVGNPARCLADKRSVDVKI